MHQRDNESHRVWFRTARVFRENGDWYFSTREAIDVGPYRTELEAQVEADILKNMLRKASVEESRKVIREFMFDSQGLKQQSNACRQSELTDYVISESATNLTIRSVIGG